MKIKEIASCALVFTVLDFVPLIQEKIATAELARDLQVPFAMHWTCQNIQVDSILSHLWAHLKLKPKWTETESFDKDVEAY